MNLPNKLTVLRMCLVPVIILVLLFPVNIATNVLGAFIFLAASLTEVKGTRSACNQQQTVAQAAMQPAQK